MKTKAKKYQKSGLPSRPDEHQSQNTSTETALNSQPSTLNSAKVLPFVNFKLREDNRALSTEQLLDLLRLWMPEQYDLAEVAGKWVWLTFPEPPAEHVRGQLSQFGFHWNNARKCWQHPCGLKLVSP